MKNDRELISGCIKGEAQSQKELYDRYASKMFGICCRYSNSRDEAEDILQDAFIKVFENINRLKDKKALEAWIRRIMVNTALNHIRMNLKHKQHQDVEVLNQVPGGMATETMEMAELLSLIQSMPIGYRTVFNLFEIEGYKHREIAKMLGISQNTSKSQLLKAKRYLQEHINREDRH